MRNHNNPSNQIAQIFPSLPVQTVVKKPCFIAVIFILNAELQNVHNTMKSMQTVLYFLVPCLGNSDLTFMHQKLFSENLVRAIFPFHLFSPCSKYLFSRSNPPGVFLLKNQVEHLKFWLVFQPVVFKYP